MKFSKNKSLTAIALILTLTIATLLATLPIISAHYPPAEQETYSYIEVVPDPVGVGQTAFVVMWLDKVPPTAAGIGGDRWEGFEVEITKPDGSTETKGPYTSDATSAAFFLYTPNQVGTYVFDFTFPGQVVSLYGPNGIPGMPSVYENDTFLPSGASTTLTVQQDPVAEAPTYPLPTEYWTRPIEGENTAWSAIASNWLGWGSGQIVGGGNWGGGGVQPTGAAPNSAHIMWTKPLQDGGVVGGDFSIPSVTYYSGLSYEGKFNNPLILYGKLYYDTPLSDSATDGPYVCVDLLTGETLWENEAISPSFGQLYLYESFNQHGVIGDGYLWQTVGQTWMAFDPRTGSWLFNMTDVPSGTTVNGPNGEILRYVINGNGNWLALWNSSAGPDSPLVLTPGTSTNAYQYRPIGKNANMSNSYTWNVTIPDLPGLGSPAILSVIPGDLILGTSTSFPMFFTFGTPDPYTFWAISLKPETRGQLLWIQNYTAPPGNQSLVFLGTPNTSNRNLQVDPVNRVFFVTIKETSQWYGYDLDTGEKLWGPIGDFRAFQYYGTTSNPPAPGYVYDGKLYVAGYGGELHCFDSRTGNLLWIYGNGGPGNSTNSGTETPWGDFPLFISTIADGKIYLFSSEHSPNAPPYKGYRVRCVNATTGEELWTLLSWFAGGGFGQWGGPIADGYYIYFNTYDMQVYCIGKGPSKTTVATPLTAVTEGSSVMITGTVTDQSAGTNQDELAARFPNGVPAMSDDYMGEWMEYVYMQKPCPENVKGVTVHLTAIDPNGNFQDIGEVTTDAGGSFGKMWTPPVPGEYHVTATFEGSESYYGSFATAYFAVDSASSPAAAIEPEPITPAPTGSEQTAPEPTTPEPTASEPTETTEAPFITTETAILAAVAVACAIGIVNLWALRKRK
jgi:outer membrane protein assembly factor BamB